MQRVYNSFLGFDPKGEQAVVLDVDDQLRVYKLEDWSEVALLPGTCPSGQDRRRGAISPDGKWLVIGSHAGDPMLVYDLETKEREAGNPRTLSTVAVRFSEAGDRVHTVASDGTISRYQVKDWSKDLELREQPQFRGDLAVYQLDGRSLILSFNPNGAVALFRPGSAGEAVLRGHGAPGEAIAVDAQLEQIVTAHEDGTVCRWDLRQPQNSLSLENPEKLAFTADESRLYVGVSADTGNGGQQVCNVDVASGGILGYLRWFPVSVAARQARPAAWPIVPMGAAWRSRRSRAGAMAA